VDAERLERIAVGVYAVVTEKRRYGYGSMDDEAVMEALRKLGYEPTYGGWAWWQWQLEKTTQIPCWPTITVERPCRRKFGKGRAPNGGRWRFETYAYWRQRDRVQVWERILDRGSGELEGRVWLRSEFLPCASRSAVDKALRDLTRRGVLAKLARGVYVPAFAWRIEKKSRREFVILALRKLGADPAPGSAPDRIKVRRRVGVREMGYGDIWFKLEYELAESGKS